MHVYVSDTKNERKVMEEVISEGAKRSETEEDDPAEEDRRAFSAEFDGQLRRDRRREARKVASANARWGRKQMENITIPLKEFNVREKRT